MILLPEEIAENSLRKLSKGVILVWEYFQFDGGSKKTSRFVLLTDCRNDVFLAIRPTSRIDRYEKRTKIFREFLKISANEDSSFAKPTIFDLNQIHILPLEKMKKLLGEQIKCSQKISDETLRKIEDMVRKSITLRKDWIDWILNSKRG